MSVFLHFPFQGFLQCSALGMHSTPPRSFPAITMQAGFSKLFNQFSLVILQEHFKGFFPALPAILGTGESTPIMRVPMQNF
jgi:hypothetical protein